MRLQTHNYRENFNFPEPRQDQQRIVVVGDASLGKSVLTSSISKALRQLDCDEYPYVVAATVDGEGRGTTWFQETMKSDPKLGLALKDLNKGTYSAAHFDLLEVEISAQHAAAVVIIPIGGVQNEDNFRSASMGNKAIVVHRDSGDLQEWKAFCERAGLSVLAQVKSDLHGEDNVFFEQGDILECTVSGLDRGADVSDSQPVQTIARNIIQNYRGLQPAPILLDLESLPSLGPTYKVEIEKNWCNAEAGIPVARVRVGFNQLYENVSSEKILTDACQELDSVLSELPEYGAIQFDGPASTPVAVAFARKLSTPQRGVTWRAREGGFVFVNNPEFLIVDGKQPVYGDVLDEEGRLVDRHGKSAESSINRFEITRTTDGFGDPPRKGALLEVAVNKGHSVAKIVEDLGERIDDVFKSGEGEGTLYISGALPIVATSLLAERLGDRFDGVAIFVPQHDGENKFLLHDSEENSSTWLPTPIPVSGFGEISSRLVESDEGDGGHAHLITAALNKGVALPTAELVKELASSVKVPENSGGLYVNGRLPLVASATLAQLYEKSPWVANFVPDKGKYLVSFHNAPERLGLYIGGPREDRSKFSFEALYEELRKDSADAQAYEMADSKFLKDVYDIEKILSRTANGVYDSSVSPDKPPLLLAGHSLAQKAMKNLLQAYVVLDERAPSEFASADDIEELFFGLRNISQRDLLSFEGDELYRTWERANVAVTADQVPEAMGRFFKEFHNRINSKESPEKKYTWTLWELDRQIHPLADGCGRMSRLMASFFLSRAGKPLPVIPSRDVYYFKLNKSEDDFFNYIDKCFASRNISSGEAESGLQETRSRW